MVDSEDDEVVQEFDVYLNRLYDPPDFVGDLFLLQYPLRPGYRPYTDHGVLERAELKEKARKLRFTYKLHQNYNFDGDADGAVDDDGHAQRHVLSSTVVANSSCSYSCCTIHQGKLIMTPVRAVNQLRPDFEAYDERIAGQKKAGRNALRTAASGSGAQAAAPAGGDVEDSAPENEAAMVESMQSLDIAPVRVEIKAKGTVTEEVVEEPWGELEYFHRTSNEAKDILTQHIAWPAIAAADAEREGCEVEHPKLLPLELDGSKDRYLASMCGGAEDDVKDQKKEDPSLAGLSMVVLSRMTLERQVEAIIRHFGATHYSRQLRRALPPSAALRQTGADELIISALKSCAVLVAGRWILKSELLGFDGDEGHARDMLLCLFAKRGGNLALTEFDKWEKTFKKVTTKQSREEMTRLFAELFVDRQTGDRHWRVKSVADPNFELRSGAKHRALAEEFSTFWDKKRAEVAQKLSQSVAGVGATPQMPNAAASAQVRQRHKMLAEAREVLATGAKTTAELKREMQKRNPTTAIRENELVSALQQATNDITQIRNLWILGNSGNKQNDQFRATVLSMFKVRDTVNKSAIPAEYERMHGEPIKISEHVIRSLLREVSERIDSDTYVLKGVLERD